MDLRSLKTEVKTQRARKGRKTYRRTWFYSALLYRASWMLHFFVDGRRGPPQATRWWLALLGYSGPEPQCLRGPPIVYDGPRENPTQMRLIKTESKISRNVRLYLEERRRPGGPKHGGPEWGARANEVRLGRRGDLACIDPKRNVEHRSL